MTEAGDKNNISNKSLLWKYAGIGAQITAGLLVFVFLGKWIDSKGGFSFPVFIWVMPLIFIIGLTIKVIKDTSSKKK